MRAVSQSGAGIAGDFVEFLGQAELEADTLAKQVEGDAAVDVRTVAADLRGILEQIDAALRKLQADVQGFDIQLVQDIDDELTRADKALSNTRCSETSSRAK